MSRVSTVVCLIGLALSGRSTAGAAGMTSETEITAHPWQLKAFADESVEVAIGHEATLEFDPDQGTAHGIAGCNRYATSYESTDKALTFGLTRSTMMACPDEPRTRQETAFLAAFESVAGFELAGPELRLLDSTGALLLLFEPRPDLSLTDVEWLATGINNGRQGVVSVIEGTSPTALFDSGSVSGSAGCNRYQASFSEADGTIEIGPAAATRMMCGEPPRVMEQEAWFLAALSTAATYHIERDNLELRTSEGALALKFRARE